MVVDLIAVDETPGTVVVLDADVDVVPPATVDGHGLDVMGVVDLARRIGAGPRQVLVVGCPPVDCSPVWTSARRSPRRWRSPVPSSSTWSHA